MRDKVLDALLAASGWQTASQICDLVYTDPDGGPMWAEYNVRIAVAALRRAGHRIVSTSDGYRYWHPGESEPRQMPRAEVAEVMRLIQSGLSYSDVAICVGLPSTSAVSGIVYRERRRAA